MKMFNGFPRRTRAEEYVFGANNVNITGGGANQGTAWHSWQRPRGVTMLHIFAVAPGGGGGNSVAGAASLAAGGGGGGSGSQGSLWIGASCLPGTLFLSIPTGMPSNSNTSAISGNRLYVSIAPNTTLNNLLMVLQGGASGGASVGNTAGPLGTGGTGGSVTASPLAGFGSLTVFSGQNGISGGVAASGSGAGPGGFPTTGLVVMGGTGGGANRAAGNAGQAGGLITGGGLIPSVVGGIGGAVTPTAGGDGMSGIEPIGGLWVGLGGTGGGSTGISAGPAGSNGGNGGAGAPGCGGGGGGGAFTGFTPGIGGRGGDGYVVIRCF